MSDHGKRPRDTHHQQLGFDSRAIHVGQDPDPAHGAVAAPIYQTSTFAFRSPEQGKALFSGEEFGFFYTRMGNPTTMRLEECVASLERGHDALAVATGMAAVSTVFLAFLRAGDHIVSTDTVYGPTRLILEQEFTRYGVEATFVDTADIANVERAMRPETKIVYLETPANPTLKMADLAEGARIAHAHGAIAVVDNTFASPVLQRPLELGCDIVLHSTTKYINGHSDVIGGIVVAKTEAQWERMKRVRTMYGFSIDPHQSWLVLRGVKTLPMRVRAAQANAIRLAPVLEAHPAVARVYYPGLPSHPQYELGLRQMDGPGSMIAFEMRGGYAAGVALMKRVKIPTLAVSLGGVESLIEHPASMTHAGVAEAERLAAGITPGIVRLSVGCETFEDIEADMLQALEGLG